MVTTRKRKARVEIKIEPASSASSRASAGDPGAAKRRRKGLALASIKREGVKREVKSESKKGEEDCSEELLFRPRPRPSDHAAGAGAGSGAGASAGSGRRVSVKREVKKEAAAAANGDDSDDELLFAPVLRGSASTKRDRDRRYAATEARAKRKKKEARKKGKKGKKKKKKKEEAGHFGKKGKFLPFQEAMAWALASGIRSQKEWYSRGRAGLPSNIPASPHTVYATQWPGWGTWLGTGRSCSTVFREYASAQEWARQSEIRTAEEWMKRGRANLPADIPTHPNGTYAGKGWVD